MKFLRILFGNLTLYFQKSKSIFLLYCLCGVMSTIAFLYFYGNMVPIIYNRGSTEFYYREFTLKGTLSPDDLSELNSESLIEAVTMIHTERDENEKSKKTYIAADLGTSPALVSAMGESSFTQGDLYSVLAPVSSGLSVGDNWRFREKDFKVIGVHTAKEYRIPPQTYKELALATDRALVYAAEREDVESGRAQTFMENYFSGSVIVQTPLVSSALDLPVSLQSLGLICVAYGLVIVAFLFLFLYLMENTARETALCRILGASRTYLCFLHFWEVLLLSSGSSLAGILLHAAFYRSFFSKWNAVEGISYFFGDYLTVFLIMTLITLAVSLFFILRSTHLSPVEARRLADG